MLWVSDYYPSHKKVFYCEKDWEPTKSFSGIRFDSVSSEKMSLADLSVFYLITFRGSLDQKEISFKTQTTSHIQRKEQHKNYRLYP